MPPIRPEGLKCEQVHQTDVTDVSLYECTLVPGYYWSLWPNVPDTRGDRIKLKIILSPRVSQALRHNLQRASQ